MGALVATCRIMARCAQEDSFLNECSQFLDGFRFVLRPERDLCPGVGVSQQTLVADAGA